VFIAAMCFQNYVYAQSMWFCLYQCFLSSITRCNILRDPYGQIDARLRVVCFVGRVLGMLSGRETRKRRETAGFCKVFF